MSAAAAAAAICFARRRAGQFIQAAPPTLRHSTSAARSWTDLHTQLTNENRAGVLKAAGRHPPEVMLLPLQGREGSTGPPLPIFAAFVAPLVGGDFVRQVRRLGCYPGPAWGDHAVTSPWH